MISIRTGLALLVSVVTASSLAAAPAPGSIDAAFAPEIRETGTLVAVARAADGSLTVGGDFSHINGVARTNFARISAAGDVDLGFRPRFSLGTRYAQGVNSATSVATALRSRMVMLPDGGILVSGVGRGSNELDHVVLWRVGPDGVRDPGFNPNFTPLTAGSLAGISSLAVQPDGRVVVAGHFTAVDGVPRYDVARLLGDGTLDTGFVPDPSPIQDPTVFIHAIAPDSEGRIVFGGGMRGSANSPPLPTLYRLLPNGAVDRDWGRDILLPGSFVCCRNDVIVRGLEILANGQIVVATGSGSVGWLARLLPDWSEDPAFFGAVTPDFPIDEFAGSEETKHRWLATLRSSPYEACTLVRFNGDGTLDPTFDSGAVDTSVINCLQPLKGGKTFIGGQLRINGEVSAAAIVDEVGRATAVARVHRPGGARSQLPAANGQLYVGGTFSEAEGLARAGLARLDRNGQVDPGFTDGFLRAHLKATLPYYSDFARSAQEATPLAVQPDGKLLVAVTGSSSNVLVRVLADGSLDPGFRVLSLNALYQHQVIVQEDGKILVAGVRSDDSGVWFADIYRLNADGSVDAQFPRISVDGQGVGVACAALQADGSLVYAGVGGVIHRVTHDGVPDQEFKAPFGPGDTVVAMAQDSQGRFLVIHGSDPATNQVTRLLPDASVDPSFELDLAGFGRSVAPQGLALQADDKVLLTVSFQEGNHTTNALVRLNADGSWDQEFQPFPLPDSGVSITVQGTAGITVQGNFERWAGAPSASLVRLHGGEPEPSAPHAIGDPEHVVLYEGASLDLHMVATGFPAVQYQWQHDGRDLSGATHRTLHLPEVHPADSGTYSVVMSNSLGVIVRTRAVVDITPTIPLAEALNAPDLIWSTSPVMNPAASWVGIREVSHDSRGSAHNQPLSNNGVATLWTDVPGRGTLGFWWKVSSEPGYDFLEFRLGTEVRLAISGETEWQHLVFPVEAGDRAEWSYRKDGSFSAGKDGAWIDQVAFTPAPTETLRLVPVVANDRFQLSGSLEAASAVVLQVSTNLSEWQVLTNWTGVDPADRIWTVVPGPTPRLFYRLVSP